MYYFLFTLSYCTNTSILLSVSFVRRPFARATFVPTLIVIRTEFIPGHDEADVGPDYDLQRTETHLHPAQKAHDELYSSFRCEAPTRAGQVAAVASREITRGAVGNLFIKHDGPSTRRIGGAARGDRNRGKQRNSSECARTRVRGESREAYRASDDLSVRSPLRRIPGRSVSHSVSQLVHLSVRPSVCGPAKCAGSHLADFHGENSSRAPPPSRVARSAQPRPAAIGS